MSSASLGSLTTLPVAAAYSNTQMYEIRHSKNKFPVGTISTQM